MKDSVISVRDDKDIHQLLTFSGYELLHIIDVFEEEWLAKVIAEKGMPGAVLSDHVVVLHPLHLPVLDFFGLPLWAMRTARQWSYDDFQYQDALKTDYAFNFMINKIQCNRYLLMKLVEMGAYQHFQYT